MYQRIKWQQEQEEEQLYVSIVKKTVQKTHVCDIYE